MLGLSAFQSFPTLVSQKYAPNLRKSLRWLIENRKSIQDFLREIDEDSVSINNCEFQSNDVVGTFGKPFKVCGRSRVDAVDGISQTQERTISNRKEIFCRQMSATITNECNNY